MKKQIAKSDIVEMIANDKKASDIFDNAVFTFKCYLAEDNAELSQFLSGQSAGLEWALQTLLFDTVFDFYLNDTLHELVKEQANREFDTDW